MQNPEILAPAGSREALLAALRCGADAVYVGGKLYSARSSAANFDLDELAEASRLCHLYGAKLHLAVNTLVTDAELPELARWIRQAGRYADACIVQDLGVLRVIRDIFPELPLHASTQMSIHTPEGALEAAALGCGRVVAARELSAEQLAVLCALPVEVEVFVHGALCMSVSGQCSFSALVGGRSANRGQCAQACRLPWRTPEGKNPAALSLKDVSLAEHVGALRDMGVDSFKIEGRMKRPEYVAAAVTAMRMALDGKQPDMETLQAVFSRSGFTDGYFTGKKQEMFGFRRKEDVLAGQSVRTSLAKTYAKPRIVDELAFTLELHKGQPAVLTAAGKDGRSVTVKGEIPEIPQKSPLREEVLARSMQKLGGTVYSCGAVRLVNPDGLTLAASSCNALRRSAAEAMDKTRIEANAPVYHENDLPPELPAYEVPPPEGLPRLHVRTKGQMTKSLETGETVCVPVYQAEKWGAPVSVWLEAPRIITEEDDYRRRLAALRERGYAHLICHNLADIRLGRELGFTLHGGFGLNVTDRMTADTLRERGLTDVTASIELRMNRIRELGAVLPVGAYIYGRLPMMLLRVCPIRSQDGCRRKNCFLTDRTGRRFPLVCSGSFQELVNAEVLWLADRPLEGLHFRDFYFTDEAPERIPEVLSAYAGAPAEAPKKRTGGLYFKGGLK